MLSDPEPWQPELHSQAAAGLELHALGVSAAGLGWLDASLLEVGERERQRRFSRAPDRRSFLTGHVLLRRMLAARLRRPPATLRLYRELCPLCGGPHGRPALDAPGAGLHYSLSRTAELVLVAIADAPVGVDVEALPEAATVTEVVRALHPQEREEILTAHPTERPQVFARLWTRKEAYLKGVGSGIAVELDAVNLAARPGDAEPSGWTVHDVSVPVGFAAAVALGRL